MIQVTSLRPGVTFEENGDIYQVLTYNNVHLRKTSSVVKVKIKNLTKNSTIEKSFPNNASVKPVFLEKKELQYLYKDADSGHFMNPQTFEQQAVPLENLEGINFLKEGQTVNVTFNDNKALSMLLPPKVKLKVKETDPGVKGNSATNVYKEAVLENGLKTKVPIFINIGDEIVVDTRDGSYTSRA